MTRQQANYLLRRIYNALKNESLKFKLSRSLGKVYGELEVPLNKPERLTITVNPAKKGARGGLVSTILHECLHLISDAKERDIQEMEEEMFKLLSDRQLENLLKKISLRIPKK